MALVDEETYRLGYGEYSFNINPYLYYLGNNLNAYQNVDPGAFVFHDEVTGNNGYPCAQDWDFVTGWGSANFWKFFADDVLAPNPAPYTPSGWKGPLLLSLSKAKANQPTTFYTDKTYYVGAAFDCNGPADFLASTLDVQLDGVDHSGNYGPLPVGYHWEDFPAIKTTLKAGSHTIKEILNGSVINQWTFTVDRS